MKTRRIILVPYNFQEKSQVALENAIQMAPALKAEIYLLTVVPSGDFFEELFRNDKETRNLIRETTAKLKEVAANAKQRTKLKFSYSVERGNPDDIILEVAEQIQALYIVMGKKTFDSQKFLFFNTHNVSILTKAPCPVFMTGPESIFLGGFKNIVLPLDLSKQTTEKVKNAISLAKYYKSTIHLVGVLNTNISSKQSRLFAKLQRCATFITKHGIKCTNEIYEKSDISIYEQILKHVEKVNGDLIMIMTHQEKQTQDTYIGKTAQSIILKSHVPVVSFTSAAMAKHDHFIASFMPFEIFSAQNEKLKKQL